jgi:hypothetical protein
MKAENRRKLHQELGLPPPGEEPAFLPHPLLDQLLEMVLALGAELWVERERMKRELVNRVFAPLGRVAQEEP